MRWTCQHNKEEIVIAIHHGGTVSVVWGGGDALNIPQMLAYGHLPLCYVEPHRLRKHCVVRWVLHSNSCRKYLAMTCLLWNVHTETTTETTVCLFWLMRWCGDRSYTCSYAVVILSTLAHTLSLIFKSKSHTLRYQCNAVRDRNRQGSHDTILQWFLSANKRWVAIFCKYCDTLLQMYLFCGLTYWFNVGIQLLQSVIVFKMNSAICDKTIFCHGFLHTLWSSEFCTVMLIEIVFQTCLLWNMHSETTTETTVPLLTQALVWRSLSYVFMTQKNMSAFERDHSIYYLPSFCTYFSLRLILISYL